MARRLRNSAVEYCEIKVGLLLNKAKNLELWRRENYPTRAVLPAGAIATAYHDDGDYDNKDLLNFFEQRNDIFQLNWQCFVEMCISVSVTVQCRSCQFSTSVQHKKRILLQTFHDSSLHCHLIFSYEYIADYSVEMPTRCSFVIEFIILKFF